MAGGKLEVLELEECLNRLRSTSVGRLAVVVDDGPVVLPVNYRLVESRGPTWLALRTRPGNVIDRATTPVAFEIDEIDAARHEGWSVLVRGMLLRVDPDAAGFRERFDPEPWLAEARDAWWVIEPTIITGRRLRGRDAEWAFSSDAYL